MTWTWLVLGSSVVSHIGGIMNLMIESRTEFASSDDGGQPVHYRPVWPGLTPWTRLLMGILRALTWISVIYMMAYGLATITDGIGAGFGDTWLTSIGDMLHAAPAAICYALHPLLASFLLLFPGQPPAVEAAMVGVSAFVARKSLGVMSAALLRKASVSVPSAVVLPHSAEPVVTIAADDTDLEEDTGERALRALRIEGVHAALAQLDAEWLGYEMDLEAYHLTKPVLRDLNVVETAAYRSALYDLRGLVDALSDASGDAEISVAEDAADTALMAWGTANDHALAVGVSDRAPTERAALRRLHALTAQLADASTPKSMWPSLVAAISREMGKLSTVTASWEHLARVPVLEHRNPAAIAAADPDNQDANRTVDRENEW